MSNDKAILPCIEIEPNHEARSSVIWLHGLGADGNDFAPVVPELQIPDQLAIRFIFPHAPVMPITINHGFHMRAWYDIVSFNVDTHMDEKGMRASKSQIENLIERELDRGIPTNKIIVGGFSQGAVIAFLTGLGYRNELAGVMGLSGYLPFAEDLLQSATPDKRSMPVFIGHGTHDPVVPYQLSETAYKQLSIANFNVVFKSYPVPHTVSPQELRDISQWIQSVLN